MKPLPDLPRSRPERSAGLTKHYHGQVYRWKIVPFAGPPEYGEWLRTESDVRAAMGALTRAIGVRYYCEAKPITCPECEINEAPRVICSL